MKKHYKSSLLLILLLMSSFLHAQSPALSGFPHLTGKSQGLGEPHNTATVGSYPSSFWINYGWVKDSANGGLSVLNGNYLFPDSMAVVQFGTGYGRPWIHWISDVLDVSDPDFQLYKGYNWSKFNSYTLDSISMEYTYERHSAASVVDTIIFTIFNDVTPTNLRKLYWTGATGWNQNYGVDTLFIKCPRYSYVTNAPICTGAITIKVPLKVADTSVTFWAFKGLSTHSFAVPAGQLLCTTVSFKPGYAYDMNDTLATNKQNIFNFASYQENGANSFASYKKGYWNSSGIVNQTVRYNDDKLRWDSSFVPSLLYSSGFGLQHHQLYYKVTGTNLGVTEHAASGVRLFQNHPNPTNAISTLAYELPEAAHVRFEICDLTGRLISSMDEGYKTAGVQSLSLDATRFNPGIYFYTLIVNDKQRLTRRMVTYH